MLCIRKMRLVLWETSHPMYVRILVLWEFWAWLSLQMFHTKHSSNGQSQLDRQKFLYSPTLLLYRTYHIEVQHFRVQYLPELSMGQWLKASFFIWPGVTSLQGWKHGQLSAHFGIHYAGAHDRFDRTDRSESIRIQEFGKKPIIQTQDRKKQYYEFTVGIHSFLKMTYIEVAPKLWPIPITPSYAECKSKVRTICWVSKALSNQVSVQKRMSPMKR